jgi:hypothetical protein
MLLSVPERGLTENVGGQELLSVLLLEGLLPLGRREFEDATARPVRQQAEVITQVRPGLDVMELTAREQRDKGGVDLGGGVVADEEPVPGAQE